MEIYDELNKEEKYPAQGAYVGYLLTDYLSRLETATLTDVELKDECLVFTVFMGQFDENAEVVDALPLIVTFHRGTIALMCPTEEWWDTMQNSVLFERLWGIAEQTGCLVGLSSVDTNRAAVWNPEVEKRLEGKIVMQEHTTVH